MVKAKYIKNALLFVMAYVFAQTLSNFLMGYLLVQGGNLRIVGSRISFDPLITIAYILVYYFITLFYQPSSRAQFYLFLLTLYLSFSVGFIQGSMLLVFLYVLLRKFKVI